MSKTEGGGVVRSLLQAKNNLSLDIVHFPLAKVGKSSSKVWIWVSSPPLSLENVQPQVEKTPSKGLELAPLPLPWEMSKIKLNKFLKKFGFRLDPILNCFLPIGDSLICPTT